VKAEEMVESLEECRYFDLGGEQETIVDSIEM